VFVQSLRELVAVDSEWVPTNLADSLYFRPFMIATEIGLGVKPAASYTYLLIASPAGSYFSSGVRPVTIWLSEELTRAAPGGTGAAKCGGNYASSLLAQQEAAEQGCEQVVFLDGAHRESIEELGGMNVFLVYAAGTLVTPDLNDSILAGVTRASLLELADEMGHKVDERPISVREWREGVASGDVAEVFACGTAAVLTPVAALRWRDGEARSPQPAGEVTMALRHRLLDIQYGRSADSHGWMRRIG